MSYGIKTGVRLAPNKNALLPAERLPEPSEIVLDLQETALKPGDFVRKWQCVGQLDGIRQFSPVSGQITSLENRRVTIQNDFMSAPDDGAQPVQQSIKTMTSEQIAEFVQNFGIYSSKKPAYTLIKQAGTLIINLLESEPYLCAAGRLALERPDEILSGAKILMKACGVRRAYIALDTRSHEAINLYREKIGNSRFFKLRLIKDRYPQDDPKLLAYLLSGREDAQDYAVFDGFCCVDTYNALAKGQMPAERYVTVDGDCIRSPKNLIIPVGTPLSHIAEYCGGLTSRPHKIISGGPMRGSALPTADMGLPNGTSGLLFMSSSYEKKPLKPCMRCGRCVKCCPMYLLPLSAVSDNFKKEDFTACINCGVCSYVCPSGLAINSMIQQKMLEN